MNEADLIPNQEVVLQITQKGYVRRLLPAAFERHTKAKAGIQEEVEDFILQAQATETHQDFLALTETGRMFSIKVHEIPSTSGRSRGTPLVTLLPTQDPIAATFALADYPDTSTLVLLTRKGRIKRAFLSDFASLTGPGLGCSQAEGG